MRIAIICRSNVINSFNSGIFTGIWGWINYFHSKSIFVDLITDTPKINECWFNFAGDIYYPQNPIGYGSHQTLFQFEDGFNFEWCLNFRQPLVKALSEHVYDIILCSEPESAFLCYQLGVDRYIKLVYYCHEAGVFFKDGGNDFAYKQRYFDFIDRLPDLGISFGVPSLSAKKDFGKDCLFLPYPCDPILLEPRTSLQDGVIINGTIQTRKNFSFYLKTLLKIKNDYGVELKAKVLTAKRHVDKAINLFKDSGYTNFDVRGELTGKEKYDFISSAKVGFFPSLQESFGLACFESLRYHKTVLLKGNTWSGEFKNYTNSVIVDEDEAASTIYSLHSSKNKPQEISLMDFQKYQFDFERAWDNLIESPRPHFRTETPRNKFIKFLEKKTNVWVSLKQIQEEANKKDSLYLTADIEALYKSLHVLNRLDSNKDTYLSVGNPNEIEFQKIEPQKESIETQLTLFSL